MSSEKLYLNRPFKWSPVPALPYSPQSSSDSAPFWEATLNGNARKISAETKSKLKDLGLAHIYTPSGLHLSLILNPLFLFMKSTLLRSIFLSILCILTFIYLPGWPAVKRVLELKLFQTLIRPLGIESKYSFLIVMIFDLAFGTYQDGGLSFCFSFLFLSLIYTRMNFLVSAWWFFIAQIIISVFLEQQIFLTNILATPILTLLFSFLFPFLLVIRLIPPWHFLGNYLSGFFLSVVDVTHELSSILPKLEATPFVLLLIGFMLYEKWRWVLAGVLLFSSQLNFDQNRYKASVLQRKYFYVEMDLKRRKEICRMDGGFEKCSYRSRSTRKLL